MDQTTQPTKPDLKRPICNTCGRELVFASIVAGQVVFNTWLCDCDPQPEGVAAEIIRAREWYEQALVYELEVVNDDSQ